MIRIEELALLFNLREQLYNTLQQKIKEKVILFQRQFLLAKSIIEICNSQKRSFDIIVFSAIKMIYLPENVAE